MTSLDKKALEIIKKESGDKRKGMIITIAIHSVLVFFLFFKMCELPDPPPGQEGVLVNLGLPDIGQGEEIPFAEEENLEPSEEVAEEATENFEDQTEPVDEPDPENTDAPTDETSATDNMTDENSDAAAEQKKAEEAKAAAEKAEQEKIAEERRRKEAAEQKKAEEARKAAEAKKKFGSLFGDKNSKGEGNTGKAGSQGDPTGDPNSSNLKGRGQGQVGGGLGSRGVKTPNVPKDNTNETGKVAVNICVDRNGKVIPSSVSFRSKGSNTSSRNLIDKSVASAKRWSFEVDKGAPIKQCGWITFDYSVK